MVRVLSAAVLAASLVGALPALAQTTTPSGAVPGAMSGSLTELDRQFMILDATGGVYEISLATLARERSSRDDIKAYASMLIQDHAEYNGALQQLARSKGVVLPTDISPGDRGKLNGINLQGGSTFDRSFILEAIRINEEDKKSAQDEAAATRDPDIKAFVQKYAAMDARHEQGAKALQH